MNSWNFKPFRSYDTAFITSSSGIDTSLPSVCQIMVEIDRNIHFYEFFAASYMNKLNFSTFDRAEETKNGYANLNRLYRSDEIKYIYKYYFLVWTKPNTWFFICPLNIYQLILNILTRCLRHICIKEVSRSTCFFRLITLLLEWCVKSKKKKDSCFTSDINQVARNLYTRLWQTFLFSFIFPKIQSILSSVRQIIFVGYRCMLLV